jgi:hypothetical protein
MLVAAHEGALALVAAVLRTRGRTGWRRTWRRWWRWAHLVAD